MTAQRQEPGEWQERIPSLEAWDAFAERLLEFAGDIRIIALSGSMGAGKTTLVRALCRKLEVTDVVASPTFAIVYEYRTRRQEVVYHMDFYRIRNLEEVYDMGYEEYFYSPHRCLIEWPEMIDGILPPDTLRVDIAVENDGERLVRVRKP